MRIHSPCNLYFTTNVFLYLYYLMHFYTLRIHKGKVIFNELKFKYSQIISKSFMLIINTRFTGTGSIFDNRYEFNYSYQLIIFQS